MANFDSFNLGLILNMNPATDPNAIQYNAYPGAIGLEVVNMGARGGTISVVAMLTAPTPSGLAAKLAYLYTFKENVYVSVLTDDLGRTYPNTFLENIAESDRAMPLKGGGYGKVYQALFRFLG